MSTVLASPGLPLIGTPQRPPVCWKVTYRDGSTLDQYENGTRKAYESIDRNRVQDFHLYYGDHPVVGLVVDGHPWLWRRRTAIAPGNKPVSVHIIAEYRNDDWLICWFRENDLMVNRHKGFDSSCNWLVPPDFRKFELPSSV